MEKEKWYLNKSSIIRSAIPILITLLLFFYEQTKNRKPVYFVNNKVLLISETQEEIDFKIFFEDKKIHGPVSMANIYFWNAGDIPIERNDILDYIIISVPTPSKILRTKILKMSREIIDFQIEKYAQSGQFVNEERFSWKILEHNDGVCLQVVFTGNPETPIFMKGTIKGVPFIRRLYTPLTPELSQIAKWQGRFFGLLVSIVLIFLLELKKRNLRLEKPKKRSVRKLVQHLRHKFLEDFFYIPWIIAIMWLSNFVFSRLWGAAPGMVPPEIIP